MPLETFAASDWNLRPEHPHWPLVWLTLLSQVAVGVSATASTTHDRVVAALLAVVALVGALGHLGASRHRHKALRNLRRSWLSREVAALSAYAGLAAAAAAADVLSLPAGALVVAAAVAGIGGVYASARLSSCPVARLGTAR